jgi:sulfur carrier protein ThiS
MMKINVEFVGAINPGPYKKKQDFEIKAKTTVKDFLETLEHIDKGHLSFIQVVCNGSRVAHTQTLKDGDSIELMLMVGGG